MDVGQVRHRLRFTDDCLSRETFWSYPCWNTTRNERSYESDDSRLLGKGFHVFADSFFSSLNLANKLLWERIYLTGILRKNRPMPQMIKNARPQAGDAVYARQGQTMPCCFRDHKRQKPVTMVSTFYNLLIHWTGNLGSYAHTIHSWVGSILATKWS